MLFIGTDAGIHRFAQEGGAWKAQGSALEGLAISGLTLDGGSPGRLLASARHSGVYRSQDGESWSPILEEVDAWSVAVAPDGTLFAGVEPAGVYRSRNAGKDWEELATVKSLPSYDSWYFPPPPHIAHVRTMVFSHKDPRTIFAGVEVGGPIGTTDGGDTWHELRDGVYVDIHNLAITPDGDDVLYAATGKGFFRSDNAGASWELATQGLHSIYMRPVVVHPQDSRLLLTAAATGSPPTWDRPEGAATILYRSRDGGGSWEPIMKGLPETLYGAVDAMAVDPEDGDVIYAGTTDGSVFVSDSLGDSWEVLAEGLPGVQALVVV